MKNLAIQILKYRIKKAKKRIETERYSFVVTAYENMIKSYSSTIMFLKSERN